MTRQQKEKVLDKIRETFLVRDNIMLNRALFDDVLTWRHADKDKFGHYREYGYEFENGKWVRCIK